MICEKCGSENVYVKDSRPDKYGYRRLRECAECGYRTTTFEIPKENYMAMLRAEQRYQKVMKWLSEFKLVKQIPDGESDNE